ncbi:TPA: helix-turn-helix transcriptional regulator [Legionella pneumophila]|uniref:helix-turn-helix transcriptional regulator n=1 Tax=Legionella pneumophila TaxID=446 RepID=UPI0007873706|nr:hypothetical protein [Legionella pneumophila]HAU1192559.1 hypothetical protein [Legionella pneumophila]HAU1639529.1 hypothetical protein [Legionella pneumophila]HAU1654429.1 hypothetical protein [Legionella pneumophila]HBD7103135.1 hypothetical protein [Legionella pneumophila]HCO4739647.1 hypothetical protein [Legionella pneumophila]
MKDLSLLVYPKQAQEIIGVKPTKFYELNKLPGFPKPRITSLGKRPMYVRKELVEWISNLTTNDETTS